ncbi:hypothetical protein GCM10023353_07790 [Tomitella cavernea]|uniref:Uncharacterized protein n=1 Tax=Tomitella cavernea TaxID=1387982 RepID=A0ABP9CES6_9ACTN
MSRTASSGKVIPVVAATSPSVTDPHIPKAGPGSPVEGAGDTDSDGSAASASPADPPDPPHAATVTPTVTASAPPQTLRFTRRGYQRTGAAYR